MRPNSDLDLAVSIDQPALAREDGSEQAAFDREWKALRLRGEASLTRSILWPLHFESHRGDATPTVKRYIEDCSRLVYERGAGMIGVTMSKRKGSKALRKLKGYLEDPNIEHARSKAKKKLRSTVRSLPPR